MDMALAACWVHLLDAVNWMAFVGDGNYQVPWNTCGGDTVLRQSDDENNGREGRRYHSLTADNAMR